MKAEAYAIRVRNKKCLYDSSSGGAFVAISDSFLKNGDAVVAAVYDYETHTTQFKMLLDPVQRDSARGSKYVQSRPGDIFKIAYRWLTDNPDRRLLFVGMGCQTDGFRRYAEEKHIADRVCLVDIICHGVPSPKLWREYARNLEQKRNGKITYLTFKDKRRGWQRPTALVIVDEKEIPIQDYVKVFYGSCALRPSCYECRYAKVDRKTDITIGDFWGVENVFPDWCDGNGVSLGIVHTQMGKKIICDVMEKADVKQCEVSQCLQPNLQAPTKRPEERDGFWSDFKSGGVNLIMKKYGNLPLKTKVKNTLLRIIGGGGVHTK